MDSEERVILKELFSNEAGLELYWFHQYKGLSVAQIYKAINFLVEAKLIIKNKHTIRIDRRKKQTILKNYSDLFCKIDENWKNKIDYSQKITNNLEKELKKL